MMIQVQLIEAIASLLNVAIEALQQVQEGNRALKQAHDENWASDDPRWQQVFDDQQKALDAARLRLT